MDTTWIILADEGRCRILEMRKPGTEPAEVEELTDAAAHARNAAGTPARPLHAPAAGRAAEVPGAPGRSYQHAS